MNGSQGPEYGDASACLKIRTPVIRRDLQNPCSRCVPLRDPVNFEVIPDSLFGRRHLPESTSIRIEVTLDLPGRHMSHVVAPLLALGSDEVVEDVLAQRVLHQGAFFQFVERFAQV